MLFDTSKKKKKKYDNSNTFRLDKLILNYKLYKIIIYIYIYN